MLMTGRIITGFCAGITSLVVPTYIGEFASPDIRGTLGKSITSVDKYYFYYMDNKTSKMYCF